jgi:hypothetical protein
MHVSIHCLQVRRCFIVWVLQKIEELILLTIIKMLKGFLLLKHREYHENKIIPNFKDYPSIL